MRCTETARDGLLVGLQLLESRLDGGVFVCRVFEFDHHQRQTVDEQNHFGALVDVAFDNRKLIDDQKFILLGILVIQEPNFIAHDSITRAVFNVHAFGEVLVKLVVVLVQVGLSLRSTLRRASSCASAGTVGLSRAMALCSLARSTTSWYARSGALPSGEISRPLRYWYSKSMNS